MSCAERESALSIAGDRANRVGQLRFWNGRLEASSRAVIRAAQLETARMRRLAVLCDRLVDVVAMSRAN